MNRSMSADADGHDPVLEPQPEDSADVRWALETAIALWARGETAQAVSWMQHAAQAATADGRQERAGSLQRAAEALESRPAHPPSLATAPASASLEETKPMTHESTTTQRRNNMTRTAPYQVAPDDITRLVAPDAALLEACESDPQTHREPPKSQHQTVAIPMMDFAPQPQPGPPSVSAESLDATLTRVRPPTLNRDRSDSTIVMESIDSAQMHSLMTGNTMPNTLGSPTMLLEPMRAVRVAVVGGGGRELVVRLLDEGEALPVGAQDALLVALGSKRTS
jgi:hypothetical protein